MGENAADTCHAQQVWPVMNVAWEYVCINLRVKRISFTQKWHFCHYLLKLLKTNMLLFFHWNLEVQYVLLQNMLPYLYSFAFYAKQKSGFSSNNVNIFDYINIQ